MRVAVISDIHREVDTFEQVLIDIDKSGSSQFCGDTTQISEYGQGELLDKAA